MQWRIRATRGSYYVCSENKWANKQWSIHQQYRVGHVIYLQNFFKFMCFFCWSDCDAGYIKNEQSGECEDIDECESGDATCDMSSQVCYNTLGNDGCVKRFNLFSKQCIPFCIPSVVWCVKKWVNFKTSILQVITNVWTLFSHHRFVQMDLDIMRRQSYVMVCHFM